MRAAIAGVALVGVIGAAILYSQMSGDEDDMPPEEFRVEESRMRAYTDCVVRSSEKGSIAVLERAFQSAEEARAIKALTAATTQCEPLAKGIKYREELFRGVLAETLYRRKFPKFTDGNGGKGIMVEGGVMSGPTPQAMAACLVVAKPRSVDALLRTAWNTPEERRIVESVAAEASLCRGAVSSSPKLSVLAGRFYLAEAQLQRAGVLNAHVESLN